MKILAKILSYCTFTQGTVHPFGIRILLCVSQLFIGVDQSRQASITFTMKILSPLLAALLLSSATILSSANVQRNLTVSESAIDSASQRYLKGEKNKKQTTTIDSDNNEVWAELVQESTAFEASFVAGQYSAADGCLRSHETQVDICLASEHSSNVAVHCCNGSMQGNNLRCNRGDCTKKSTFAAAKDYCENQGMRLCSVPELESGACCDKGCGWNSQISWTSDSCVTTDSPTKNPTKTPTSKPTTSTGTLVTISGDRSANSMNTIGFMFAVEAREDLGITSLSTFTGSTSETWTEIWHRDGSYEGNTKSNSGWERIYFGKPQQGGNAAPTEITLNDPIHIQKGARTSFYIVSPGKIQSTESNVKQGRAITQNDSLMLFAGTALDYGRWENGCANGQQCMFPARTFEGTVGYIADFTITGAPTGAPTLDPWQVQPSGLTRREEQWLVGHNSRRKIWHEMYGKKYKPLKWSEGLKDMAQAYADELASDCGPTVHDSYENRGGYGECLASNTGHDEGHGSWGELKPVEKVMYRYVEREKTWAPPANYHFTQVLWYPTEYVGCADSIGTMPSGAVCRYQVCRYARAGNCSVNSFNDGSKEWWMKAVMQDASNCRPYCPPEGC